MAKPHRREAKRRAWFEKAAAKGNVDAMFPAPPDPGLNEVRVRGVYPPERSSCSQALTWGRAGFKLLFVCCLLCPFCRVGRGWVAGGSRG